MAAIDDLIAQIDNPELRDKIQQELRKVTKNKKFGLVFEKHLPECTPLYDIPVKKGSTVARYDDMNTLYKVLNIEDDIASCMGKNVDGTEEIPVDELVTVAEFGEPIYPYLEPLDSVENAPGSELWHTLIEADNYHALQLLDYLYHGKVDCIYIDPPYNTGAKDWKYNNNYVDSNDSYRHSKWLSMMEKRLILAKKLLNPINGIMIIAIDDNELNTLGLLIDELFNGYKKFCVTIVHNPNGNQGENFGVVNEFAYFILPSGDQLLSLENRSDDPDIRPLRDVSGNNNLRTDARNCFYPIYVRENRIIGYGEICDNDFHPASANIKRDDGIIEVYPIDASGIEKKWVFARGTVESIENELHVEWNRNRKIFDIIRHKTHFTYKTVWSKKEFNANSNGSKMLSKIFGNKRFEYPKSLYTVEECIRSACGNRPNALIIDFFAGSGTTLHAVNLLNTEDGGSRRCIIVTNNEVSDNEAEKLLRNGHMPGDDEWNKLGIARYVTWPRTKCSIRGKDVDGNILKGEYFSNKRVVIEKKRTIKQICVDGSILTVKAKKSIIALFGKEVLPQSALNKNEDYIVSENYKVSVLFNMSKSEEWLTLLEENDNINDFYIVTDNNRQYNYIKREIEERLGTYSIEEPIKIPMADGFPANANFFKLGFLDKMAVRLGTQLEKLIPVLWMKANAVGKCPSISDDRDYYIFPENRFAILVNESKFNEFKDKVVDEGLDVVYLVTDYEPGYIRMRQELGIPTAYQLYRDYLDNFRINQR